MDPEKNDVANELLPVVDEKDNVIGQEKRGVIHAKNLLHRAVHILVFNSAQKLYVQRRSMSKDTYPGRWDSSSSGHVDAGETYLESAVREVFEELSIRAPSDLQACFKLPATPSTGWEFAMVYRMQSDENPRPNPEEIIDGVWRSIEEMDEWIEQKPEEFAPCFIEVWRRFRAQNIE